jgi:iron complex transport system permease protein
LRKFPVNGRLAVLGLFAIVSIAAFMTWGIKANWGFILSLRSTKLAAMLLVAYAIAVSSILFQTITHNRILTPSIMGFDALYIFIQAVMVYVFGMVGLAQWHPDLKFIVDVVVMTTFSCLLFNWLFSGASKSLHLMMLVGIVFGLLFRSLSSFIMRVMDPMEFTVLQDKMFASFNTIRADLLIISAILVALVSLIGWRYRRTYDVIALGRDTAINLGVPYKTVVLRTLAMIAILVSVSTALVGPVTFFGLLVSNLTYMLMKTDRHRVVVPAAILLGIIMLVGGQFVLERLLSLSTAISVVIEFIGGLMFIALVVRKVRR